MVDILEQNKDKFEKYFEILSCENEKYNLTAICQKQDVFDKHFYDSCLAVDLIKQNATLLDVGCGAGFPSLPVCIVRPDVKATLIDGTKKKVDFCNMVAMELGLNAKAVHLRAEEFAQKKVFFDVVVSRAVASLPTLLEYCAPMCAVGGMVIAYKKDASEVEVAENAAKVLGLAQPEIHQFETSYGKRCLFVYKKVAQTDAQYPRLRGLPRKAPL